LTSIPSFPGVPELFERKTLSQILHLAEHHVLGPDIGDLDMLSRVEARAMLDGIHQ
jgi:hypothetical protein